jgi:hypothetical protein
MTDFTNRLYVQFVAGCPGIRHNAKQKALLFDLIQTIERESRGKVIIDLENAGIQIPVNIELHIKYGGR